MENLLNLNIFIVVLWESVERGSVEDVAREVSEVRRVKEDK